jgi:hypothetical protein
LKSPVLALDSNKNVAGLNRITSVLVKDNMYMPENNVRYDERYSVTKDEEERLK